MAELPFPTHRYLIEPLAGNHWKTEMNRGYLGFIERVRKSAKPVLRQLYHLASRDVKTATGTNLRNILMLNDKLQVDDLKLIKELIDINHGVVLPPEGWAKHDLEELMNFACTHQMKWNLVFSLIFRSFPMAAPFYKRNIKLTIQNT